MKKTIATLLLLATATASFAQKAGDTVTPEALGKLTWIKGQAPATWEPGKVYILECWATWCGPCIAAIPHVDELHDKYSQKGLRVIGVNVAENDQAKVTEFVEKKGEGMSYPVAYTGKGGAFETEWMKPAGVTSIPYTFVVKDGKVLFDTHPSQLSEEVVEGLLAGGEAQAKVISAIDEAKKKQADFAAAVAEFRESAAKKDPAAMEVAFNKLRDIDPENRALPSMKFQLLVSKADWAAVEANLKTLEGDSTRRMLIAFAAQRSAPDANAPEAFKKSIAAEFAKLVEDNGQPYEFQVLAGVQWNLGDRDSALVYAKRAAETAKVLGAKDENIPIMPYVRFAEAVERGELPSNAQVNEWTREAMRHFTQPGG